MNLAQLPVLEQAIFVLAALALLASFALLAQTRLTASIHSFAWQGAVVALLTALVATVGEIHHLYLSALLTLSLKSLLIPWMLHRLVRRLDMEREVETIAHPALVVLAGAGLVVFSYWVALPIERLELASTRNIVAVSLSVVLLGLWMMVARRQVVAQVLGFMSMENGLFLAAVASTRGMPLVVELGVAFDVLVAAVLFGVFFFHISESIESLDVDRLNRLTEDEGGS
ncbi:MAG TPA: formate hydrogenlyase [Gammaproteobacteria bacterium]|nr:formate hydrogenlyase [Gammaproteobacteria bacterium]